MTPSIRPIALILCALALALASGSAAAQQLRSPWDDHPVTLTDVPYDCPQPPPFDKTLYAESYYTDAHHSVIDEKKRAAEEKATEAPTHLGQWVHRSLRCLSNEGQQRRRRVCLHLARRRREGARVVRRNADRPG